MIFVTLGTFEMSFKRLLNDIEKLEIEDEIIIQSGYTEFKSNKHKVLKFLDKEEFNYYMDNADVIICHGGIGSILDALKRKKKVIAIPRLEKYNEHVDNHQIEIVDKFTKENYILGCMETNQIKSKLDIINEVEFNDYKFEENRLYNFIKNYLNNL